MTNQEDSIRSRSSGNPSPPLCVDLDETLIRTDIAWESIIQLWRKPLAALRCVWALACHGKAAFKCVLAETATIDPATLPYRQDVLDFIRSERATGREIALATATHAIPANRIADHLGLFSRVFATGRDVNLSGPRKLAALEAAYGPGGFDYMGDSRKDLPIFSSARQALLVNPSPALRDTASERGNVVRVFNDRAPVARTLTSAIRLHQWVKNALLAVPLLSAHLVSNADAWASILIAFIGFSLVASATYLVNDLVDIQADRGHPSKRRRPLASGAMPIPAGLMLVAVMGMAGFGLSAALLPAEFVHWLIAYIALTLAYSFDLKRRLFIDALTLAILYTLRILAGGAAIGVVVSEWLLMFSLFIFLSLAFLKRIVELQGAGDSGRLKGRGYSAIDLETVRVIGICCGLIAVLVLSLYINSPATAPLYRAPKILWLLCPLLIYWIARIWFLAARDEVHHDPVVFALYDWRSHVIALIGFVLIVLATTAPWLP